MKQPALLFSVLMIDLSVAMPLVRMQPDPGASEKSFHNNDSNSVLKRSPMASLKLFQTTALASNRVSTRRPIQPDFTTRPSRKLSAKSGNGKILPPAEASGLLQGPGFYETNEHGSKKVQEHSHKANPEGLMVTGPVSANIRSVSFAEGSKSTAQGMYGAAASVESGTPGCITCQQPGQPPIRMDIPPGIGKVVLSAHNTNRKMGPVKVTAETEGAGETSAAAMNHPI